MIFSASAPIAMIKHNSPWHYASKQGIFALIGLFVMFFFMNIPYFWWKKAAPILLLCALFMLTLVLIFGTNINGARRWFVLGGFNLQPAEFTKLALIVYLSSMISRKEERIRDFKKGLFPLFITVGILLLLIMKQPDFGTVLILFCIAGTMIFIGGVNLRHIALLSLGLIPLFIYLAVSKSYRLVRIISFVNPIDHSQGAGYQLIQSLYALGHGHITGTGLGKSVQKLFYLPEAHTDFIFAVIGEEFGFLGSLVFLLVFFLFLWRGLKAALKCDNPLEMMLGMGIVIMIGIQFFLNIGAVTGSLPITGVPLPFISYGGSSLILCLASTGILLSISRDNHRRRLVSDERSTQNK